MTHFIFIMNEPRVKEILQRIYIVCTKSDLLSLCGLVGRIENSNGLFNRIHISIIKKWLS